MLKASGINRNKIDREVLKPLLPWREKDGMRGSSAACEPSPSPQPSPVKGEGASGARWPLAAIGLALLLLVLSAPVWAQSLDELVRLAREDALPEVRQAAAGALGPLWADSDRSDEALRALALEGASKELRGAAAGALGLRWTRGVTDPERLKELSVEAEFPEVRWAASRRLAELFAKSSPSLADLEQLALEGTSPELRAAAIEALASAWELAAVPSGALAQISADGSTEAQRRAASTALLARLSGSPLHALDTAALAALSRGERVGLAVAAAGSNGALREAAGPDLQAQLADAGWSLDRLRALAGDPAAAPQARAAAGAVLGERLLDAGLPLAELEQIAMGSAPELRAAAGDALVQALVGALGRRELTQAELLESVSSAATPELARARAEAAFVLLRTQLISAQGQAALERIADGGAAVVGGSLVNGAEPAIRAVAADFLVGIYTFFGFIDRFSDPIGDLTIIAADWARAPEWRGAAGRALALAFRAEGRRALETLARLDALLAQMNARATAGERDAAHESLAAFRSLLDAERDSLAATAEVAGDFTVRSKLNDELNRALTASADALSRQRLLTVRAETGNVQRILSAVERAVSAAPEVDRAFLEATAVEGTTPELRAAAADALGARLLRDARDSDALARLAAQGATPELRSAVVPALARLWGEAVNAETLYRTALEAEADALRAAAARAFVERAGFAAHAFETVLAFVEGAPVTLGTLALDGACAELRRAAAQAWIDGLADGLATDALVALAASDPTPELRAAAAGAAQARLIEAGASEAELFELILTHTLAFGPREGASPELSAALAGALAHRFSISRA